MAAAEAFTAFESFISARRAASAALKTSQKDTRDNFSGPLCLIGRDTELLRTLGNVCVALEDSGLTQVSEDYISAAEKNTVVLWDFSGDNTQTSAESGELFARTLSRSGVATIVYVRSVSEARDGLLCSMSCHEFIALPGSPETVAADFHRLVKLLRCPPAPCMGPGSYFVSLTFPDVTQAMSSGEEWKPPDWVETSKGKGPLHSGLEVRADLLRSQDESFVLSQLAMVRRRSEGLPIIYTVRSKNQGGGFPDDEDAAWQLMMVGLRFGVEYIDVEACWSREGRSAFLALAKRILPGIRIIGSYHDVQRPLSAIPDADICALFHECAHGPPGAIDISKVVGRAESAQCSIRMNQAALRARSGLPESVQCVIAICTTDAGRLSRALNVMLGPTPVAHPSLPGKAAPGQLSAIEIEGIRCTLGLPSNPFFPGSPSMSPRPDNVSPRPTKRARLDLSESGAAAEAAAAKEQ